ncbi:MAG: hypothetical protein ACW99G_01475 [Candidatus Thorarchaeota archaeon]|jgi:hypothetical protein
MIEIINRKRSPISLMVKSLKAPRSFTIMNIPGVGAGHNVKELAEERITDHVMGFVEDKTIALRKKK